ncbi:hypothetical protein V8E53_000614 [Lactarius tabidus]
MAVLPALSELSTSTISLETYSVAIRRIQRRVDSPPYDGDIESSTTVGRDRDHPSPSSSPVQPHSAVTSTPPSPTPLIQALPAISNPHAWLYIMLMQVNAFTPSALAPEDIQAFVRRAIDGEIHRKYKINEPPTDRPVLRIYADVAPSKAFVPEWPPPRWCEQVTGKHYKFKCVMDYAERCEAVQHCRWVDEVVPDAPCVIDVAFVDKYNIDYVAHDEEPYLSAGHEDVYEFVKSLGVLISPSRKFIPTRGTLGRSTSSLLECIVKNYRKRDFDKKLEKNGTCGADGAGI